MFESNSPVLSEQAEKELVEFIVAPDCFSVEVLVDALKVSIHEITTKLTQNPAGLHEFYFHHFDKRMKLTLSICIRASSFKAGSVKIHSLNIEWNPEDPPPMENIYFRQQSKEQNTDLFSFNMYLVDIDISEGEGTVVMGSEFAEASDYLKQVTVDDVLAQSQLSRCISSGHDSGHSNVEGLFCLKFERTPEPNCLTDMWHTDMCLTDVWLTEIWRKRTERTGMYKEDRGLAFRDRERFDYSFVAGLQQRGIHNSKFQSTVD